MRYRLSCLCVLVSVCFQLIGCSQPPMSVSPNAPTRKISVMADGRIAVDGSPATIDSVRVSLKRLAEKKGVVWYYRRIGLDTSRWATCGRRREKRWMLWESPGPLRCPRYCKWIASNG